MNLIKQRCADSSVAQNKVETACLAGDKPLAELRAAFVQVGA